MPWPSYCLQLSQQEFKGARLKRSAAVQRWRLASLADCSLVGRQTKVIILYWGTRDGTCGQDTRGTNVFQLRAPCHSAFKGKMESRSHWQSRHREICGSVLAGKSRSLWNVVRVACINVTALTTMIGIVLLVTMAELFRVFTKMIGIVLLVNVAELVLYLLWWSDLYNWLMWLSWYCIHYDDRNCTTGYCGWVDTVFTKMIGLVLLVTVAELLPYSLWWLELYYWLQWPTCYCIHYDDWNCTTGYCGRVVTVFIMMTGIVLLLQWPACYCIHYDDRTCIPGYCGQVVTVFIVMIGIVSLVTVAQLLLHSLW